MGNRPVNTNHLGLLLDCDPELALTGLPQSLTSPVLPTALLIMMKTYCTSSTAPSTCVPIFTTHRNLVKEVLASI